MSADLRTAGVFALSAALFLALWAGFDRGRPDRDSGPPAPQWMEATPEQREEVLGAITLFNKVYQDFYATGGDPHLIDLMPAEKEVKHQIFRDLGYLRDAGRVLVMDEAQTLPVLVEVDGAGSVRATVYEEWNYVYQDAGTRKPVTQVKGMGQGFQYTLGRGAAGWQIRGWEPADMERPVPAEGFVW